jgi:hypothetical protein
MGRRLARKGLIPVSSQRTPPGLTLGPVLGRQLLADRLEHHHPPQRSAKSPRSAESHAQCQVLATASRCRRGPRSRSEPGILTPDRGRTRNPWTRDSLSDMAQSPRRWVHAVVPPQPRRRPMGCLGARVATRSSNPGCPAQKAAHPTFNPAQLKQPPMQRQVRRKCRNAGLRQYPDPSARSQSND